MSAAIAIVVGVAIIIGIAIAWRRSRQSQPPEERPKTAIDPPPSPPSNFPTTYPQPPVPQSATISYDRLRELLETRQFDRADRETERLMRRIVGVDRQGYFEIDDLENFPSEDLAKIDSLWLENSDGRFGFSVQKRIYNEVGDEYSQLASRVGWVVGGQWFASEDPADSDSLPPGYYPLTLWKLTLNSFGLMGLGICFEVWFSREDL